MVGAAEGSDVVVCDLSDTIDRPILPVTVERTQLLVIRDGERIVACERACPHEQADLALGRCADGKLYCPRHYAWFDLGTGQISPGWIAPPLQLFPVMVRGDQVVVRLSASPYTAAGS
ncbi:MAG TPA: Rieske (2Fe-2S) protein [Xanthobacteraceae bacterium]|nr:Rieske (2Fe-2S) protein [Xanthobacteraceae bacterium]